MELYPRDTDDMRVVLETGHVRRKTSATGVTGLSAEADWAEIYGCETEQETLKRRMLSQDSDTYLSNLSIYLSNYQSINLSIYQSINQSIYLSI